MAREEAMEAALRGGGAESSVVGELVTVVEVVVVVVLATAWCGIEWIGLVVLEGCACVCVRARVCV